MFHMSAIIAEMDKERVQRWRASMELVNQITLDEARNRTPSERFALLTIFLKRLQAMGKLPELGRDLEEHLRWSEVQRNVHERTTKL